MDGQSTIAGFARSVVAAIDGGLSRRGAAARFGVSVSSAIRWHQLARAWPRDGQIA